MRMVLSMQRGSEELDAHAGSEREPYRALLGQVIRRLRETERWCDETYRALDADPSELRAEFHNVEHHRAHMASSFYLSPFDKAACMTIDGFGDFVSAMFGRGEGNRLRSRSVADFQPERADGRAVRRPPAYC